MYHDAHIRLFLLVSSFFTFSFFISLSLSLHPSSPPLPNMPLGICVVIEKQKREIKLSKN